jgi:hypothetical protein
MTHLTTLLEQWQTMTASLRDIDAGWTPSPLQPVMVEMQSSILTRADLSSMLQQLAQASGWLLTPGDVIALPTTVDITTLPLQAEACINDKTWQLRHLGNDSWHWQEFLVQPCEADQASHLCENVRHQSSAPSKGALNYQVLWEIIEAQSPRVTAAVFTGFEDHSI